MQLSARFNEKMLPLFSNKTRWIFLPKNVATKKNRQKSWKVLRTSDQKYLEQLKTELQQALAFIDDITNKITTFISERKSKEQNLGSAEEQYYQETPENQRIRNQP